MQRVLKDLTKLSFPYIQKNVVITTLYELIEAINCYVSNYLTLEVPVWMT